MSVHVVLELIYRLKFCEPGKEQAQVMEGNQDNDSPTAVEEEEVANLFNVSPDIAV